MSPRRPPLVCHCLTITALRTIPLHRNEIGTISIDRPSKRIDELADKKKARQPQQKMPQLAETTWTRHRWKDLRH